jgi:hypothetical protein
MRFAIVTPSYHLDYERCVLLNESIMKWVPETIRHSIIVDKRDYKLFSGLKNRRTDVLTQEDIVPARFWSLPYLRDWRFSFTTLPVRGWMWQQVVKLSMGFAVDADVYVVTDSDVMFVKPFDPAQLLQDGKVPLFREEKAYYTTHSENQEWHRQARRLLGLAPQTTPFNTGFVTHPVFWRRDVLKRLVERIGSARRPDAWLGRIGRLLTFSEFVLYGVYVEASEGPARAGHYFLDGELCHSYWPEVPMTEEQLRAFSAAVPPEKFLMMINAKSNTPERLIRSVFLDG